MTLSWREEMNIGHDGLDRDHRAQHDLIRRFVNLPTDDLWRDDAAKLLASLHDVTQRHFAHEELIMAKLRYSKLEEHRAQHRRLLQILGDIVQQVQAADESSPFPFSYVKNKSEDLLQFWFFDHFAKSDLPLRPFIARQVVRS